MHLFFMKSNSSIVFRIKKITQKFSHETFCSDRNISFYTLYNYIYCLQKSRNFISISIVFRL